DHVLVQRRDIDDGDGLADRVVLDVVEVRVDLGREIAGPLAPRELLVEPRRARVERGTDGHVTTSEWKGTACSVGADPAGGDGMAQRYDAVVIGGGHNGLTAAAYLAKAGKRVLVLERRHVLGGGAVPEEVFPGFRFSVFSYVVSLLRPEIIRDLDLPRHGLEILPLDGTITPLDDDSLWRVNDGGTTIREVRHGAQDASERHGD